MRPKITILMPVFNREKFVDEAIRSVFAQEVEDFELLIVDDGSSDSTPDVLESWKKRDPRVVIVTLPVNQGISRALNIGLAHARGAYVARLDSDDLMMPRRLAEQAALLDARPDVVLVSCAYDIVDLAGNHLRTWREDHPAEVTAFLLHFFNVVGGHGQVMFRPAAVVDAGGYPQEYPARVCEDYDLWVRLRARGRIETLPLVGMTKRTHPNQVRPAWELKRAGWSAVMRASLEPYLQRAISDYEIAALLTLWRHDGTCGMSPMAEELMQEAFARFCDEVPDRALQTRARRRIAWQWYSVARNFVRRRHPFEAMKYLARAAGWLIRMPRGVEQSRQRP